MSVTLVTGGAGYIGSHTCVELLLAGRDVVVVDDLSNASPEALRRVEKLGGRALKAFVHGDVRDRALMAKVFAEHAVEAVIHFAAKKAVGESVAQPLAYYDNNLQGLLSVLQTMDAAGCRRMVFSSSATVYGDPARVPIDEDFPTTATNPYGWTKLMGEQILRDLGRADPVPEARRGRALRPRQQPRRGPRPQDARDRRDGRDGPQADGHRQAPGDL